MVETNSNLSFSICPKCGISKIAKPKLDINAVKIKLHQASESIEMALEICKDEEDNDEFIHTMIRCANSYLFEAAAKSRKCSYPGCPQKNSEFSHLL